MDGFDILLVDDEECFLQMTHRLLTRRGYTVLAASGGEEALALLERYSIRVAVLDVGMPGIDGLQVLKIIKQSYPLIEVIMLTGYATVDAAVEGLKSGALDYVTKPAAIDDLEMKIDEVLEKQDLIRYRISMLQLLQS